MSTNKFRSLIGSTCSCIVIVGAIVVAGCSSAKTPAPLSGEQSAEIKGSVSKFAATVADDITRRGPTAWRDHFSENSAFFMAAEGHLIFADSDAATRGIQQLPDKYAQLKLTWGEPMIIDPLTTTLAMLGAPYHEHSVDPAGHVTEQDGYFTGRAELGPTGWRFRDAHWSVAAPPPPTP